jgi:uncharacterized lipoprotein NlpE involved in copper resistance
MKKIVFALIFASLLSFSGCNNSSEPAQRFLSIDAATRAENSPENQAIYREAFSRMDPYVSFRKNKRGNGGEFVLEKVTAARLAMSEELFAQLKAAMQHSNEMLAECAKTHRLVEVSPNVIRVVDPQKKAPLTSAKTRGLGEDPLPPGSDGWDARWYGYDLYYSQKLVKHVKLANDLSTLISYFAGVPVGIVLTANQAIFDFNATDCTQGIVVPVHVILGGLSPIGSVLGTRCQ